MPARRAAREALPSARSRSESGLLFLAPGAATLISAAIEPVNRTAIASTLQTVILVVMAVTLDRRIGWIALAIGLVAVGCMAWPSHWLESQGVGTFLAFEIAARVTPARTR